MQQRLTAASYVPWDMNSLERQQHMPLWIYHDHWEITAPPLLFLLSPRFAHFPKLKYPLSMSLYCDRNKCNVTNKSIELMIQRSNRLFDNISTILKQKKLTWAARFTLTWGQFHMFCFGEFVQLHKAWCCHTTCFVSPFSLPFFQLQINYKKWLVIPHSYQ